MMIIMKIEEKHMDLIHPIYPALSLAVGLLWKDLFSRFLLNFHILLLFGTSVF